MVSVAGTASSSEKIGNIEVAVQRIRDDAWWDGRTASWVPDRTVNLAPWTSAERPATAVAFDYTFPGAAPDEDYRVEVVATNRHGTPSFTEARTFRIGQPVPDTADPVAVIASPAEGSVAAAFQSVRASGSATDDVSVAAVAVAVRDVPSGSWLAPDGTWSPTLTWLPADVTGASTPEASWTLDLPPLPVGEFELQARVRDGVGNVNDPRPVVRFTTLDVSDTVAPDTAVTAPVDGATVAAGPVAIAGTASDDVSVAAVDIAVQDAASKAWLRPDGSRGGFAWPPARISGTGTAVTWTDEADLPAGRYGITARATDAAGNRDTTRPWQSFTARDGSGDTTAPDTAITEPANGATVAAGPVAISGTASDDVSVAAVDYAIQDAASKAWLRPDGSWAASPGCPPRPAAPAPPSPGPPRPTCPPAATASPPAPPTPPATSTPPGPGAPSPPNNRTERRGRHTAGPALEARRNWRRTPRRLAPYENRGGSV